AKRGALILPLEGDRWICTLVGMHGDHPPTDLAGYMAFAKSLPVPDMYEALRSFNPVYGQGMSAASMYADALNACLQERVATGWSLTDLWRPFFREVARAADRPWQLATGEDFRFAETTGTRGRALKLLHWYTEKVQKAASVSPQVTERFYEVMHLLKAPTALFTPA